MIKAQVSGFKPALRASLAAMLLMTMLLATAVPAGAAPSPISSAMAPAVTPGKALDSTVAGASGAEKLLQFTSAGHVLGFGTQSVYLAGLDHALRVEFAGGRPAQPVAESAGVEQNGVMPLGRVTYCGAWENIDVTYSAVAGGIAESAYSIHPGGNPEDISLRYNMPVEITPEGGLRFSFENGYMTESPPVA